jgi:hypothetical protein
MRRGTVVGLCLLAAVAAAPLPAQTTSGDDSIDQLVRNARVLGPDCAPDSEPGEIVVCGRRRRLDPRLPEGFRGQDQTPSDRSWGSRTQALEDAARMARPGSNSVVGSGGQTGQNQELVRQWYEDRAERKRREERRANGDYSE